MDESTVTQILKEFQEATKATQTLQGDILKGLDAGEPLNELMLKALEALSKITGNSVLYTEGKARLERNYK